jgi:small GTP-binding protein
VNDTTVNFQLWDTAGQEDFKSITTSFFRNAVAGLLVFDVTNRNSFYHLHEWISETKANSHPEHDIVLLLVGNKADLDTQREVSHDEAECFASQNNMNYIETSAKKGTNVHEAAVEMTKTLLSQIEGGELVGIRPLSDSTSATPGLNISSATSSYSFSPISQSQSTTDSMPHEKKGGCCR